MTTTKKRRPKAPTPGDVYRKAAKMMEERGELFPCLTVEKAMPVEAIRDQNSPEWHNPDTLAGKFILALAPASPTRGADTQSASSAYLDAVCGPGWMGEDTKRDLNAHSILALCFAAAMADTGDL